jgi:hypothetical protein
MDIHEGVYGICEGVYGVCGDGKSKIGIGAAGLRGGGLKIILSVVVYTNQQNWFLRVLQKS